MTDSHDIIAELEKLQTLAPAGFALAFHIEYTRPTLLFQTYPDDWISEYSQKGLVMSDPTVHWGFENNGVMAWSALTADDSGGVLAMAAAYGMKFGVTCAVEGGNTRSMCSFARADREFTEEERATLLATTQSIHDTTAEHKTLCVDELDKLADIGIQVSQPGGK